MRVFVFLFLAALAVLPARADEATSEHQTIFICEKSINPENIMVIYTQLDRSCRLVQDPKSAGHPVFDFYWLMNRTTFKPVATGIKDEIHKRLEVLPIENPNSFSILLNNLKVVDTDIKDLKLAVQTQGAPQGGCKVNALLTLGPSDHNAVLRLESIYAETRGLIVPKVISITLKGVNATTGQPIVRKYLGK